MSRQGIREATERFRQRLHEARDEHARRLDEIDRGERRAIWIVLLALLIGGLAPVLCAQTVRLRNDTGHDYTGWHRTTIDRLPPHLAGRVGDVTYVVGRQVGLDVRVVDLQVQMRAGAELAMPLERAAAAPHRAGPRPDVGPVSIGGQQLAGIAATADGAGYLMHWRGRHGRTFATNVWLTVYPSQGWAHGEVVVCSSNSAVPDLHEEVGTGGLQLSVGDAIVVPLGGGLDGVVVPAGTRFADGQARAVPFVAVWIPKLRTAADWSSAIAALGGQFGAVGVQQLLAHGNPIYPPGFDARAWATSRWPEAVRRVHTWEVGVCGPNQVSGDTGAQEDQVFVRGEALLPGGVGAEKVAWLSALRMASRPCHHLEADGSQLDPWAPRKQRLVLWDSRPHWHTGVSPDRLGKVGGLTPATANGWFGADVEHWLHNTPAAAARLTGSPAVQWLLQAQARIYPLQWTTTPGWSTTQPYAARAVGWEALMVVHLHRSLEDREVAARTVAHWRQRLHQVLRPALDGRDIWDPRRDDRLGPGQWWICWQQAVGAYGLDLAGELLGEPKARELAIAAARTVMRHAWTQVDGTWQSRAQMPVPGNDLALPAPDGAFNFFGMALAPAVVLRHDPHDTQARAIWAQLRAGARQTKESSWLAPGVDELIAMPDHLAPGGDGRGGR